MISRNQGSPQKFDFITCVSLLERIREHNNAVGGMFSLLKHGGQIALTGPYNNKSQISNVYKLPESGYGQGSHISVRCFPEKN